MTVRDRYDALVRESVGRWLCARAFKRERNRFGRRGDRTWEIVDFQASAFGSRDDVSFTINLGVAFDEVDPSWNRGRPPALSPDMVTTRIGRLLESGEDRWWQLDDDTDTVKLAYELCSVLHALPWLSERSNRDSVRELIRRDESTLLYTTGRGRDALRHALGLK
jgi:hypothetical protein